MPFQPRSAASSSDGHGFGRVRHDVGGVAIGANLERILALQLQQVGDLEQRARDRLVVERRGQRRGHSRVTCRPVVSMRKSRMRAPPSASASRTAATSLGRRQAEQAAAAARAADLGRLRAGGHRARDQRIDRRRRDAGGEALAVLPFGGEARGGRVPVAARQRLAHRGGGVADALEAVEDVLIAVDVPLGDLPVVGAGVARLAGVAEDDAPFELAADRRRAAPARGCAGVQLERGNAAVHGRPVILQAGRHLDHLGFDVLGDLEERLGRRVLARCTPRARRRRRRSAPTSRRCRRPPATRRASSGGCRARRSGGPARPSSGSVSSSGS